MKYCENCKFTFEVGSTCPRCNSQKIREKTVTVVPASGAPASGERKTMVFDRGGQRVFGDTKEAWKSFHQRVQTACAKCNGVKFKTDYKHKEKTCENCGEIYPLPRTG